RARGAAFGAGAAADALLREARGPVAGVRGGAATGGVSPRQPARRRARAGPVRPDPVSQRADVLRRGNAAAGVRALWRDAVARRRAAAGVGGEPVWDGRGLRVRAARGDDFLPQSVTRRLICICAAGGFVAATAPRIRSSPLSFRVSRLREIRN